MTHLDLQNFDAKNFQQKDGNLSGFIKNILIYNSKMNASFGAAWGREKNDNFHSWVNYKFNNSSQ